MDSVAGYQCYIKALSQLYAWKAFRLLVKVYKHRVLKRRGSLHCAPCIEPQSCSRCQTQGHLNVRTVHVLSGPSLCEVDVDGWLRGSKVACVRVCVVWPPPIRNLWTQKQNVCCANRSAEINEAVCGAPLRCLPLIINGTADFGMECGGLDWWPYDLSTCILAPHNFTPAPKAHIHTQTRYQKPSRRNPLFFSAALPLGKFLIQNYLALDTSVKEIFSPNMEIITDINISYLNTSNHSTDDSP